MNVSRRTLLRTAAAAGFLRALPGRAHAQTSAGQAWPSRFVRLVVPAAAGGANEPFARTLSARLSEMWGQQVIVENKPGAAGNIAAEAFARSEPDGHSIFLGSFPLAVNRLLYSSVTYDPVADFAPVTLIGITPNIMAVPNSSPARSVSEFIAHAKANPGKITFASSGTGTSIHLSGEFFKRVAGIEMTHVPYRGGAPALADLYAGRVDLMFNVVATVLPQMKAGNVRGLAVTTAKRVPVAAELPTLAESGLPGFDVSGWFAFFVAAKTPVGIIKRIHADTIAALADPAIRGRLEDLGIIVVGSTPEVLGAHLKSEIKKWGPVIKEAGIRGGEQ
jgi:tripartite-type tricarboxylate transporter receptor subunit TctC